MKTLAKIILVLALFYTPGVYGQAPSGMSFQGIIKDNQGGIARMMDAYVKCQIIAGNPNSGSVVYEDVHTVKTTVDGIFSLVIGKGVKIGGSSPSFNTIEWSKGPYHLNVKSVVLSNASLPWYDPTLNYVDVGTTQLWSVPFALFAASSASSLDTAKMLEGYLRKGESNTSIDTAQLLANRLKISDTTTMLDGYARRGQVVHYRDTTQLQASRLRISDTATMLQERVKYSDTAYLVANRLKISDTTTMLDGYARRGQVVRYRDTAQLVGNLLRISDTSTMLKDRVKYSDTAQLVANRLKISDTTTMLDGYARIGQVVHYSDTTQLVGNLLRISDTATMLQDRVKYSDTAYLVANRLKISDTTTMLDGYSRKGQVVHYSDTAQLVGNLLRISDTATMLKDRVKYSDTSYLVANRLKISDTATMLSGYMRTSGGGTQPVSGKYTPTVTMITNASSNIPVECNYLNGESVVNVGFKVKFSISGAAGNKNIVLSLSVPVNTVFTSDEQAFGSFYAFVPSISGTQIVGKVESITGTNTVRLTFVTAGGSQSGVVLTGSFQYHLAQ